MMLEKRKNNGGSLTLEAAIMMPMFIMLMLLVNGVFIMFMGNQIIQHTLIQSTKSLSFDPYGSQRVSAETGNDLATMFVDVFSFTAGNHTSAKKWYVSGYGGLEDIVKERYMSYLKDKKKDADHLLKELGVKNGTDGLDFSGSKVEDGVLNVSLKYTQEFLFNAMDLASFDRELKLKVKLLEYKE